MVRTSSLGQSVGVSVEGPAKQGFDFDFRCRRAPMFIVGLPNKGKPDTVVPL